ncbi:MAG: hypothetical protein CMI03_16850 [Oceanospirillaceae bacterium]|uniref:sensor histidine kinase n=1 Tax=unclassified Thalassolituus TaxID=2624967 RepID=UPI000C3C4126|nr:MULTISPECIES: ATP-binding protein [unclassified Thalassolituus]MAS25736.1 hypothetical protein [Oceanospirillaceae bacterium]MBL34990.1 hypothetical protein [Oceanospirillaceae bacterium]MBS54411.1 hypothetical protein [Oceanospirillaceae bacterium]
MDNQTDDLTGNLNKPRRSILWRVILYFAAASVALSLLLSAIVGGWNYHRETREFEHRLQDIRNSYSQSLGSSLWFYDEIQIRSQIKGIMNLEAVNYVRVTDQLNMNVEQGVRPHHSEIQTITLTFNNKQIGILEIAFNRSLVIQRAWDAAVSGMFVQLISLMLLATLLGFIVHTLVNRRIRQLADEVKVRTSTNFSALSLRESGSEDEIDQLTRAFNALGEQMNTELLQKNQAQQQLRTINLELEDRVNERTHNLQRTVDELNHALDQLNATQTKLIEAEKLSSLGGMVAGIAHEINTPLGLCITIQSYINDNYQTVREAYEAGSMKRQDFADFMGMLDESLSILDKNLQRAAHLIKSFKQVSEDQTGEHIRRFVLNDYLKEIQETLSPKFKQNRHKVEIDCADSLWMETYAGAISQIITNLIMNSLLHGFEHRDDGLIRIQAAEAKGDIIIRYSDNGKGLNDEAKQKIFEPFYTTKRGQGGTGLGMHLVYNIVHQRLHGDIQVEDTSEGAAFRLTIPKVTVEES